MEQIREYIHTVQYYETDKMGVTHHSNYIRWMEEARVNLLSQIGWDYGKLEEMGIASPVVSISCDYRKPTTFSDRISVRVWVKEIKSVTMRFCYEMKDESGDVVFTAESLHGFFRTDGKPLKLKKEFPELYGALEELQ